MKDVYENVELEIISFDTEDIIGASLEDDQMEWIDP